MTPIYEVSCDRSKLSVAPPIPVSEETLALYSEKDRQTVIENLAGKLTEISEIAGLLQLYDFQRMLDGLSVSFEKEAAEIASASYGPLLIEKMSLSVWRMANQYTFVDIAEAAEKVKPRLRHEHDKA